MNNYVRYPIRQASFFGCIFEVTVFVKPNWRKIARISAISLLSLLLFILLTVGALTYMLRKPSVQTKVTQWITGILSDNLNTQVRIGYVDIDFFNTLMLRDALILDQQQDTLLYARELRVDIALLSIWNKQLIIENLKLNDTYIGLMRKQGQSDFNYQFILDALAGGDTTSSGFQVLIALNHLELNQSRIRYGDHKNALDLHISLPIIDANIDSMDLQRPFFALKNGLIESPVIHVLIQDLPQTKPDESTETDTALVHLNTKTFGITTKSFMMNNARFVYQVEHAALDTTMFDANYIQLNDINIHTGYVAFVGDSITGDLNHLSLAESCGFRIDTLKGQFRVTPFTTEINNMLLRLPRSRIQDDIQLTYYNFPAFLNFNQDVNIRTTIKQSTIDLRDIACFATELQSFNEPLNVSGIIRGSVSEFKGKHMHITFGTLSTLKGDINIFGLPDLENTFIDFVATELRSNHADLNKLNKRIQLPEVIKNLGTISFNGNYTGFINDFVAYGALHTDLGTMVSDLNMKNVFTPEKATYVGTLSSPYFNLGKFSGADSLLGKISFNSRLSGTGLTSKSLDGSVIAVINEFDFNQYRYHDIDINGAFHQQDFTGRIQIDDPNVNLDVIGTFDWKEKDPAYHFLLTLNRANLRELHFSDADYQLSAQGKINARGTDPDSLQGHLRFDQIVFTEEDRKLILDSLSLQIDADQAGKHIRLQSPVIQASVDGHLKFADVYNSLMSTVSEYFPSLPLSFHKIPVTDTYTISIKTKDISAAADFFYPGLTGLNQAEFTIDYNKSGNPIQLNGSIPKLQFGQYQINNIRLITTSHNNRLTNKIIAERLYIQDSIQVDEPQLEMAVFNDSVSVHLFAKDDINRSLIDINGLIKGGKDSIQASLYKSSIIIRDEPWELNNNNLVVYGKNYLRINDLQLSSGIQSVRVFTNRQDGDKTHINLSFTNLNAGNFYRYIRIGDYDAGGIINGNATILNVFDEVRFQSDFVINQFYFNGDSIDRVTVKANYDTDKDEVQLSVKAKDTKYDFEVSGTINPSAKTDQFNLHLELLKFRLNALEKYLSDYISSVSGIAAGAVDIKGTIEKPVIFGKVDIPNCALRINYLQTEYQFQNETITFYESRIDLDEIILYDKFKNKATLGGEITHNHLSDIWLNLFLNATQFNLLNTTARDNSLYYGQAFAGGIITFKGQPDNLEINANLVSKPGTAISIPITDEYTVSENETLHIISTQQQQNLNVANDDYHLRLNFELELNTNAAIKIIFDQKAGDIINGTGKGNLRLDINSNGDFNMYGNYVIEQGDYLFTLQNFINKKFIIGNGGTISWNGDPYEAKIDIDAIYSVQRTTISELMQSNGSVLNTQELNEANQKIPVDVYMNLSGSLMQPNIGFDIRIPSGFSSVGSLASRELERLKQDPNELNKQVFGLLIMNRFLPANIDAGIVGGGVNSSVSEFLFNQLSYWASQNKFNIGVNVNYNTYSLNNDPTNDIRRREFIVGLQKSLFNNRLTVGAGGNFDVSSNTSSNVNRVAADVNVQFKITPDGRYILSAYNKSQYDLLLDANRNKRGVSIAYRKEFDNFSELFRKQQKSPQ